jgi:hypothetical protein
MEVFLEKDICYQQKSGKELLIMNGFFTETSCLEISIIFAILKRAVHRLLQ